MNYWICRASFKNLLAENFGFTAQEKILMTDKKWNTLILSDANYLNLVAEVSYGGQFLLLLDREQGRDCVCITLPQHDEMLGVRIPLSEFIAQLKTSAENLCR